MEGTLEIQDHVRCMIDTDGAVLLDLKAGKYYSLNSIGARIWGKLQEGLSLSQILDHLAKTYPVEPERLQGDLSAFVRGLEEKGLVHGQP